MVIDGFSSSICGRSVERSGVRLGFCVLWEGFHALHWKMLSWLVFIGSMWVLRLRCEWIVRSGKGGCMWEGVWSFGEGSLGGVGVCGWRAHLRGF